ncbi:MAG: DUF4339 domain-containing protein [Chlamydiota bacterium]
MWPFFYTLAFGLTGAYYAKKMNKNPYIWFTIGCLCKTYALIFILLLPAIKRLSIYFIRKKIFKALKNPAHTEDTLTTIDVPAYPGLIVDPIAEKKLWYYLSNESQTVGPMSFPAFYQAWKKGEISKETFIWNETLSDWTLFKKIFSTTDL